MQLSRFVWRKLLPGTSVIKHWCQVIHWATHPSIYPSIFLLVFLPNSLVGVPSSYIVEQRQKIHRGQVSSPSQTHTQHLPILDLFKVRAEHTLHTEMPSVRPVVEPGTFLLWGDDPLSTKSLCGNDLTLVYHYEYISTFQHITRLFWQLVTACRETSPHPVFNYKGLNIVRVLLLKANRDMWLII